MCCFTSGIHRSSRPQPIRLYARARRTRCPSAAGAHMDKLIWNASKSRSFLLGMSGAFDKVNCRRLLRKLQARGVPNEILFVLQSWLSERVSRVAARGKLPRDMKISNMVYQGTVLGPSLWNIFYADAAVAINLLGFLEVIFADDLNCFKKIGSCAANLDIVQEMQRCQQELHKWGACKSGQFRCGQRINAYICIAWKRTIKL